MELGPYQGQIRNYLMSESQLLVLAAKHWSFGIVHSRLFLGNLVRDFLYASRARKDGKFAFVTAFALALGIGASPVVFSVFYNLVFNAFAAKDAARLVLSSAAECAIGDSIPVSSMLY